jgi:EmrB/QacA subfamily drug resistance transporter
VTTHQRTVLVACILATAVVLVDSTVVNVALPAIERDLGGGLAGQQWTANAYLLTLGSLLLIGGSLGDVFGERRVFGAGVVGFGVTSVLCAAAPTIEVLVAARALQGVAGALLTPAALAVIVNTFSGDQRGRAIGAWTAWAGIGAVLGPLVGGQIVDTASWRWIFAINVPLLLVTLFLIGRTMTGQEQTRRGRVDLLGAGLCGAGLAGMTYGLIEQPLKGFGDPRVSVPLAVGALLFAAFLAYERRAPAPMLPLDLFKRRNFAIGNVQTLTMYGGLGLLFFFLVLFLQQVAGYSALEAGMATLPVSIVMFFLSARFGALADRFGPRLFMGGGPLLAALGLALFARLDQDVSYVADLLPAILLFAVGLSMTVAPLTATVLADADEHNAGVASGVNNAIARVAGLVAVAAVGLLIAAQYGSVLDERLGRLTDRPGLAAPLEAAKRQPLAEVRARDLPPDVRERLAEATDAASVSAFRLGMGIAAGLVAGGGLLGLIGLRNPRRDVSCADCPGGALAGAPAEAVQEKRLPRVRVPTSARH